MIRLDKYLADMQVGTRSQVKEMTRKGRVMVNGAIVKKSDIKIDLDNDKVFVDGFEIGYVEHEYYMLNKPVGVLSAANDSKAETVVDLIVDSKRKDLFPVGRLDKDATGLMLITNDGELSHRLLSPKKHVPKTYLVEVEGVLNEEIKDKFFNGLDINICKCNDNEVSFFEPEIYRTLPAKLDIVKAGSISCAYVTLSEGKFHQVKRMFMAVGCKVISLKRVRFGSLELDKSLNEGEYRSLSEAEVKMLSGKNDEPKLIEMLDDVKGVIFDMDGTLLDSMYVWKDVDEEFLGKRGLEHFPEMIKEIEGMSFHETAIYFKEKYNLHESLEEIELEWHNAAFDKYANEIQCKPMAKEFLHLLKEKGLKLGIATSNSRKLANACLKNLGIIDLFDAIITGEDVSHGKPDPEIYLKASEKIGVFPRQCLIFEDVVMGIQAGISAGMKTCAVYDQMSEILDDKKRELADYYIMSYSDLI